MMNEYLVMIGSEDGEQWTEDRIQTIPEATSPTDAALIALRDHLPIRFRQVIYATVAHTTDDNIRPNGVPMVVRVLSLEINPAEAA